MNHSATSTDILMTPSTDKPREWWERWLFLLPIMVWLSFVGQFMWPAYPDSFPFVVVWTLLTGAFLWFVHWNVLRRRKRLAISEGTYNYDGNTVFRKRYKPVDSLLSSASTMFFLGTGNLLLVLFLNVGDPPASNSYMFTFAASFLVSLFVSIWPSRVGAFERWFAWWGSWLLLILSLVLLTFGIWAAIPRFLAGSPASWPTLLAFAQHEAEKVDHDVHLERVSASRNYYVLAPSSSQYPSDVRFSFTGREHGITVEVIDADPPRLSKVRVSSGHISAVDTSSTDIQLFKERTAKIKVGPRDEYQKTESEGRAFALKYGADPSDLIVNVDLSFNPHPYKDLGVDTFWSINYIADTPTGLKSLDIRVDAVTGKILDRGEN